MWLFKGKHNYEFQETKRKDITEKINKAIEDLRLQEEARQNAIQARAVRHLEAYLDEIADYMIENMDNPMYIHSKPYPISEVLGIEEKTFDNCDIMALKGKDSNMFGRFLCDNKLTMAINDDYTKVMFAYGRHSMFKSGWNEWAGYDCY